MILATECVIACLIFGAGIIIAVLCNKAVWYSEYAPEVQAVFLEKNPEYKKSKTEKVSIGFIVAKVIVSAIFAFILTFMVHLAGATTFVEGFLYSYILWFVVNLFDLFALDWGVLMYWKKVRLPGTEDMDKEYRSNKWHHVKEGMMGVVIGIPVSLLVGGLTILFH